MKKKGKPTIAELERILSNDGESSIEILPNGEIRRKRGRRPKIKPLTYREDLGGEYARSQSRILEEGMKIISVTILELNYIEVIYEVDGVEYYHDQPLEW